VKATLWLALLLLAPAADATSPLSAIAIDLQLDGSATPGQTVTLHALVTARGEVGDKTWVNWTLGPGMTTTGPTHYAVVLAKGSTADVSLRVVLQRHGQSVVEVYATSPIQGGSGGGYRRAFVDVDHSSFYLDSDSPPARPAPSLGDGAVVVGVAVATVLAGTQVGRRH